MKLLKILLCCSWLGLSGCSTGTSGSTSISATTTGQCSPMTVGSCTINLTYNTGSIPGLAIAYTATPQNQPAFGISTAACVPQGIVGTQTCSIIVNYNSNACVAGNQNETVTFSLGTSATSNEVVLSCSPF